MFPLFLNACTPISQPNDHSIFTTVESTPSWDADTITDILEQQLSMGLPNALSLRNAYVEILSNRDEACPSLLGPDSLIGTWEGGCATETHDYYGTGIFIEVVNGAPDIPYEMALQSSFDITSTQNEHFVAGGISTRFEMLRGAEYIIEETIGGTYQYDKSSGWLQAGITASFQYEIASENNRVRGYLDGGIGYPDITLQFSMLQFDKNDCAYPFGDLQIRDPNGMWFEARFDDCSGCGSLSWNNEEIDTLCIGEQLLQAIDTLIVLERE